MKKRIILCLLFIIVAAAAMAIPSIAASASSMDVYSWADFRSALENSYTTEIRLMSDISIGAGGANINPDKPSLVIDGGSGTQRRRIYDSSTMATGDTLRLMRWSRLSSVTLRNAEVSGNNPYGIIWNNGLSMSVTFDNVVYTGPRLAHWRNGTVTIKDSTITIAPGRDLSGGEIAMATNVRLEGNVRLVKMHPTVATDMFYIDGRGGITVAPNAQVVAENNQMPITQVRWLYPHLPHHCVYTEYSGFVKNYTSGAYFNVGEGASFRYSGNNYFQSGQPFSSVVFSDRSNVRIATYGNFPIYDGMMHITGTMSVGRETTCEIDAYSNIRTSPAVYVIGNMTVDTPNFFHVQNSSNHRARSLAVGTGLHSNVATFNFRDITSLTYGYTGGGRMVWSNSSGALFSASVTMRDESVQSAYATGLASGYSFTASTGTLRDTNLVEVRSVSPRIRITYRYVDRDLPGNPQLPGSAYNDVVDYVTRGTLVDPRDPRFFRGNTLYRAAPETGRTDYVLDSISPPTSFTAQGDTTVTYYYRKAFYANVHYVERGAAGYPRPDLAQPQEVMALRGDTVTVTTAPTINGYTLVTSLPLTSAPIMADGQRIEIEYSGIVMNRMVVVYVNVDKYQNEPGYVIREIDTGIVVPPGGTFNYTVPDSAFTVADPYGDVTRDADYTLVGSPYITIYNVTDNRVYVPFKHNLRIYVTYYDMRYGPYSRLIDPVRMPQTLPYSRNPVAYTLTLPQNMRQIMVGTQRYTVPDFYATQTIDPLYNREAFESNLVFRFPAVRQFIYTVEYRDFNSPIDPPFRVIEFTFTEGERGIIDVRNMMPDPNGWSYRSGDLVRDYGIIYGEQGVPMVVYFIRVN